MSTSQLLVLTVLLATCACGASTHRERPAERGAPLGLHIAEATPPTVASETSPELGISPAPGSSRTPEPEFPAAATLEAFSSLTVEKAVVFALDNHPSLVAAAAQVEAAAARVDAAGLWENPEAIMRMEQAPLEDESTTGDADYLLGFSQPIPTGDRLAASRSVAEHERHRAEQALAATRREIERDVRGAFGTALYSQRVAQVRAEFLETSRRQRDIVEARLRTGDAVSTELARIELQQVSDRFEFEHSEALRDQALVSMAMAMASPASVGSVEGDLSLALDLPSLSQLLAELDRNPALLAMQADSAAARARVRLADEQRAPDVRLDLLYRRIGAENRHSFDVGFALPVRLFNDGRADVRRERARAALADARVREARLDLEGALRDAHVRASHALEHMQLLEDEVLPRAERLVQLVETRRAAGDVSLHELLNARRQWLEARLAFLETLHEVLSAWADLSTFLGAGV